MERIEQEVVSDVYRVVENYNQHVQDHPSFTGVGTIELVALPDDPRALIDTVVLAMQRHRVELAKSPEDTSDLTETIDNCVTQIYDQRSEL